MEYSVSITKNAKEDIDEIHRYITVVLKVPGIADGISSAIYSKIRTLSMMPKRNAPKIVSELPPVYYVHVKNFVIYYFIFDKSVEVFAVAYKRRDLMSILEPRAE